MEAAVCLSPFSFIHLDMVALNTESFYISFARVFLFCFRLAEVWVRRACWVCLDSTRGPSHGSTYATLNFQSSTVRLQTKGQRSVLSAKSSKTVPLCMKHWEPWAHETTRCASMTACTGQATTLCTSHSLSSLAALMTNGGSSCRRARKMSTWKV